MCLVLSLKNLSLKQKDLVFNNDIRPLLSLEQVKQYQLDEAYKIVFFKIFAKIKG